MKAEINIDLQDFANEVVARIIKSIQEKLYSCKVDEESLFTVKSLAKYLEVSDQWIYERIQKAEIPVIKVGKFPRFKKSDIDDWLNSLKVPVMNPLSSRLKRFP